MAETETELQRLSKIAYAPYNKAFNKVHFMNARKEALKKIKEIKKK